MPQLPQWNTYQQPVARDVCHNSNPFVAVVRSGNVSKCTSCGGVFPRNQQVLVIKHIEKEVYTKAGEAKVSNERPHYYHALLQCLLHKHPYFTRQLLQIDSDMYDTLTPQNKTILDAL